MLNLSIRRRKTRAFAIAMCIVLLFFMGLLRAKILVITRYIIENKAFSQTLTIVQLSDLHCEEFGINNRVLVNAISSAEPDLIVMTGDIINKDSSDDEVERMLKLIKELAVMAPVYYSIGNHEASYIDKNGTGVLNEIDAMGAVVLNEKYEEIELNGQWLRIGGVYGYVLSSNQANGSEQAFMKDFTNTDMPTILLSHMSEGLLDYDSIDSWHVDLVFSGHTHGGQIRLPFVGGLFKPETGWLPKYSKGMFKRDESTVVLSAGLGSSEDIPRFNNPPEIVVATVESN